MSITCVEAGDLLPETVPRSRQIESRSDCVGTNAYRNSIILVKPPEARRDRLTTIIQSKWQTKVTALASAEEWIKPCDYVPADLVLLSQFDNRPDADRVHDITRLRHRKPRAQIFTISNRNAGSPLSADEPLQIKFIFEEFNNV